MHSWPVPHIDSVPGAPSPLHLYDSADEEVKKLSIKGETATMYVCGITPYDSTHLGHAATYLTFDLIYRQLLDNGYKVNYAQNITDVDDPLFERAERDGVDWRELGTSQINLFRSDMELLSVFPPQHFVGAMEAIDEITEMVQALLDGVGSDLRELASAISQLVFDTGGKVTREAVHAYYVGVAEVANWDIADAAVAGRVEAAVSTCRRALQLGASPVAIASALANKVGNIARLYSARGDQYSLASQTGMAPYAVKLTQPVARRWSGENITKAVILMAELKISPSRRPLNEWRSWRARLTLHG